MELQAFRTVMTNRIRAFDKYVRDDMRDNPLDWPAMNLADWEEQFEAFCSLHEGKDTFNNA
jgi:hypothetical protein